MHQPTPSMQYSNGMSMADREFEREHLVIIEKCPLPIIRHRSALYIIANDNNTAAIIEKSSDSIIIK